MSNEPLGIVEEGRRKAEYYSHHNTRQRILNVGPIRNGSPYSEPINPFGPRGLLRLRNNRKPYFLTGISARRRPIWPEHRLGIDIERVVQAVSLESGVPISNLVSWHRERRVSMPRHAAMYLIDRYCPEYSLPDLGYIFHRDHTTVMHAIEATNIRLDTGDVYMTKLIKNVRARLNAIAEASQHE
jgi:hypothetical protein